MFKTVASAALCVALFVSAAAAQPVSNPSETGHVDDPNDGNRPVSRVNLSAATPYANYFYRTGASMADHDTSLAACVSLAAAMDEPLTSVGYGSIPYNPANGVAGSAAGGLIAMAIQETIAENAAERREPMARAANVENCMVAFGWEVRTPNEADGLRLAAMDPAALRAELSQRVGMTNNPDLLVRAFNNELTNEARFSFGPAGGESVQSLSLRLIEMPGDTGNGQRFNLRDARRVRPSWIRMMRGMGVVAVRFRGHSRQPLAAVRFLRMNPEGTRPATDGQPNAITVRITDLGSDATWDEEAYFEAPPGVWRLAEIIEDGYVLSLCLSAPQFEIREGQGIFAGTIDITESMLPVFGPEAGEIVQNRNLTFERAEYTQAGQVRCSGAYLYALNAPAAEN